MGFITGLKALNDAEAGKGQTENYQKVTWLKLAPGQEVLARFVNELDENSPNYDEQRGLAGMFKEHSNPKDYLKKAVCSMEDEGRCWACEMHLKENSDPEYKGGWKAKPRFYINVEITDGTNKPYVAVWSQGVSAKSPGFQAIKEHFIETGSLSNVVFKMKRKGSGTDTVYTFFAKETDSEPHDWTGVETFDLQNISRTVPYAEQRAFYLGYDADAGSSTTINW